MGARLFGAGAADTVVIALDSGYKVYNDFRAGKLPFVPGWSTAGAPAPCYDRSDAHYVILCGGNAESDMGFIELAIKEEERSARPIDSLIIPGSSAGRSGG